MYVEALLHGRWVGEPDAPAAFETEFGWVLAGNTRASSNQSAAQVATHHGAHQSTDELIRRFWETEESPTGKMSLTPEEKFVMDHFKANHSRDESGRFVVPLPKKADPPTLGECHCKEIHHTGKISAV